MPLASGDLPLVLPLLLGGADLLSGVCLASSQGRDRSPLPLRFMAHLPVTPASRAGVYGRPRAAPLRRIGPEQGRLQPSFPSSRLSAVGGDRDPGRTARPRTALGVSRAGPPHRAAARRGTP